MTETILFAAEARIVTSRARNYAAQLCKHFQHKLAVSFEDNHGRIAFAAGVCELNADDADMLVLQVSAVGENDLPRLEDVVERHLKRFAFREELIVQWNRMH